MDQPKFAYLFSRGDNPFGLHVWVVRIWEVHEAPQAGWTQKGVRKHRHDAKYIVSKLKAIWSDHTQEVFAPRRDGVPSQPIHRRVSLATMMPSHYAWQEDLCFTREEARAKFEEVRALAQQELENGMKSMQMNVVYYEDKIRELKAAIARSQIRAQQVATTQPILDFDEKDVCDTFKKDVVEATRIAAIDAAIPFMSSKDYMTNLPEWVTPSEIKYTTLHDGQKEYVHPIKETSDGRVVDRSMRLDNFQRRFETLSKMEERLEDL